MPVPVVVPPGVLVRVQVPEAGNPLRITLPVATPQMGWVIAPTTGAVGVGGWILITTWPETGETQPSLLLTVKVWVPVASPVIVVLYRTLVLVAPLGMAVRVQVPVAGSPLSTTLPVATLQVGWVMAPTMGAAGVTGWILIKTDLRQVRYSHLHSLHCIGICTRGQSGNGDTGTGASACRSARAPGKGPCSRGRQSA